VDGDDSKLREVASDRLRLQVRLSEGGEEQFSWIGTDQFVASAAELAGGGPFGTGALGPLLDDVLLGIGTKVDFTGERKLGEKTVYAFRYRIVKAASHYIVHGKNVIAYDGTLILDPATGDILRLTARTGELPESTGAREATATIEFGASGREDGMLIPASHQLEFVMRNGDESRNRSAYSRCGAIGASSHPAALPVLQVYYVVGTGDRYRLSGGGRCYRAETGL